VRLPGNPPPFEPVVARHDQDATSPMVQNRSLISPAVPGQRNERAPVESQKVGQFQKSPDGVRRLDEPSQGQVVPDKPAAVSIPERPVEPPPRFVNAPDPRPPMAPPPSLQAPPQASEPAPRIEIGSIEVRLVPPAQPVRKVSRPKTSGSLARPAIPFGLRQI
jgi:hypothetical protein